MIIVSLPNCKQQILYGTKKGAQNSYNAQQIILTQTNRHRQFVVESLNMDVCNAVYALLKINKYGSINRFV